MVIEEILTIGTITDQIIEVDQEAGGTIIGQVIGVVITPPLQQMRKYKTTP